MSPAQKVDQTIIELKVYILVVFLQSLFYQCVCVNVFFESKENCINAHTQKSSDVPCHTTDP